MNSLDAVSLLLPQDSSSTFSTISFVIMPFESSSSKFLNELFHRVTHLVVEFALVFQVIFEVSDLLFKVMVCLASAWPA